MKTYVLGFIFSPDLKRVLLVRKEPQREDQQWQNGLLNGIGGGIELGDGGRPIIAMQRECKEECGLTLIEWESFAKMGDARTWEVHCFARSTDAIEDASTIEREQIGIYEVSEILSGEWHKTIENIPWLVALAIDSLTDGRPKFAEIRYP